MNKVIMGMLGVVLASCAHHDEAQNTGTRSQQFQNFVDACELGDQDATVTVLGWKKTSDVNCSFAGLCNWSRSVDIMLKIRERCFSCDQYYTDGQLDWIKVDAIKCPADITQDTPDTQDTPAGALH